MKFYKCNHCGNIVTFVEDKGVPVMCCGEKMQEIIPGTVEASTEKHIPVYTTEGTEVHVVVGAVEHPTTEEHYIDWIVLESNHGIQMKNIKGQKPDIYFKMVEGDSVKAVYAYCNLHGLWKA